MSDLPRPTTGWFKRNPYPSMLPFVWHYGRYERIPLHVWTAWEQAITDWMWARERWETQETLEWVCTNEGLGALRRREEWTPKADSTPPESTD